MTHPTISILIPTYQRIDFLGRLLDSIASQSFQDVEVIITDDSASDVIEAYISKQSYSYPLYYWKNEKALGTPLNWTAGMVHAKGEWIKIIHDDDWLADENALQLFYDAAVNTGADCVFSGYQSYYEANGEFENKTITQKTFGKLLKNPCLLFADNKIGPPSVLMFYKNLKALYDPALKWLVDLEGYMRMLRQYKCVYIDRPLINMSYNETQVTNSCFRNPDVEIPEALILYKKFGNEMTHPLLTYDAWWRLLRNLSIRSETTLQKHAHGEALPSFLLRMLAFQQLFPAWLLKFGVSSKCLMFISYLTRR